MPVSVPLPNIVTLPMPVGTTVGSGPVIIQVPLLTVRMSALAHLRSRGRPPPAARRPPPAIRPLVGEATQRLRYPLIA